MSYASAAALCDVSEMEIRRKVEAGDLELIYWGRLPRVLRSQVVALLAAKLEASRAERAGTGAGA